MMLILFGAWCVSHAVPAKPGYKTYTQSDGKSITVQSVGDEFFHFFMTQDGLPVELNGKGDFCYRTVDGISSVMAHNAGERNAAELSYIAQQQTRLIAVESQQQTSRRLSSRRKVGETQVPTMGSPRVPILLVQYTDKKMANSKQQFEAHYKTSSKSVYQYFVDQSNGKYTPQYDLYGIYDLPKNRAYYGGNSSGNDSCVATMVIDAIKAAGDEIDWSLYDNDGDGEADVCIVVYAGVGEAQASRVRDAIWPCQWDLNSGAYYGDGDGAQVRNGVTINRFAVFNEISGGSDYGTTMDGIGTFCHEFSHCLGLPDFYETTYSNGYYGMGTWSLMNSGCYNGGSVDGDTPVGYSAYEKNFMSWIDLIEPTPNTHYTLPVFNSKSLENDQAIKITSHLNRNEYFILENRRKQGWDQYIADEGVLITHFTYVASRWADNSVNDRAVQLATIIPADGTTSTYNESGDLYGETNHEFTATSSPAAKLNMMASGSLASSTGGAGTLDKPVTEITLNSDKTASLWYIKAPEPELNVEPQELEFKVAEGKQATATFTVSGGVSLTEDVTLVLTDTAGVFSIDKAQLTAAQVADEGTAVNVTFTPKAIQAYDATILVATAGVDTITVMLHGEGLIESETPVMQPADETQITSTSFRAEWTDNSPAENVKSYTLYVDYVKPITGPQLLEDADFSNLEAQITQSWWSSSYTNVSGQASNYLPQGWTCGNALYVADGAIIMGSDIKTKAYEMPDGYDKISAVVKGKTFSQSNYGTSQIQLRTSGGATSQNVSMANNEAEYTLVADAAGTETATFVVSNYPLVSSIKIYAGNVNEAADVPLLAVIEQGDSLTRVIEGITEHYYVVRDLLAGATYTYKVEAIYINDTHSTMSNVEKVTLAEATVLRGDVNGDGKVDVIDVNILINIMLGNDSADNYNGRANVDGEGIVDVADVNAVINIMLNNGQ